MRTRLFALGATVALLSLAGCSDEQADTGPVLPPVQVVQLPAASAGGACILWDYEFIEEMIGVTFEVAAAGQVDDTSTCVVQTTKGDWPYLSFSVVESTKADADLFVDERMPAKATKLKGLGEAGYRQVSKAKGDRGPIVEIAWLSEAAQLQTLRYTFEKSAKSADVKKMESKLLDLAKGMDTTNG
ncbi:hypothetical protein [Actinoplanes sp. NPDC051494]|uniref:hypothetical protein n=1 Tax=Actinoplanes sp. NPDC051494 TaxID=3363907 RepID=UPI0037AD69D6